MEYKSGQITRITGQDYYKFLGLEEPPKSFLEARKAYLSYVNHLHEGNDPKAEQKMALADTAFAVAERVWGIVKRDDTTKYQSKTKKIITERVEAKARPIEKPRRKVTTNGIIENFNSLEVNGIYKDYKLAFSEKAAKAFDEGVNEGGETGVRFRQMEGVLLSLKRGQLSHARGLVERTYTYHGEEYRVYHAGYHNSWLRAYYITLSSPKMIYIISIERAPGH